ncbi:hypothetical protein B9479_006008 [Cryptococcus floricola]|uniref:CUE domain-containing protein n=1 Tax=Cryptococcus floricola TaxID=2591691 RepID=A0A5D3ARM6_9TREE|nr:hypothetical protein B9479_006008 [Cryptococcus floricola]
MPSPPASPPRTPTPTAAKPVAAEPASPPIPPAKSSTPTPVNTAPAGATPTSPPPATTVPTTDTVAAAPTIEAPVHADPKIAELQAIFPTVDVSVIELVLETCGGSTDRAIEQLLGMTDPNFKPDELDGSRQGHQVDLDAEFARSLQMQDEDEFRHQQRQYEASHGAGANSSLPSGQLPYQPRVRRARPPASQAAYQPDSGEREAAVGGRWDQYEQRPTGDNPPGALMVEEKLERFAEVGKQTFNSFLSRAKQKYAEFQTAQSERPQHYQPGQSEYAPAPGGSRGGEQNRYTQPQERVGGLWGERSNSPSISGRSESFSSASTLDPQPVQLGRGGQIPVRQSSGSKRWQPSDAYDDPLPPSRDSTSSPNRVEIATRNSISGSPDKAGKIDLAKLGILPKKRVDLMSTSPSKPSHLKSNPSSGSGAASSSNAKTHDNDSDDDPNPGLPSASFANKIPPTPPAGNSPYRLEDSDDELEYTKNPFDEK